ncbi:uncharacterized protein LOC113745633 [Larimichthys crocea]|uniref:uncharacterized protein LOC113745633 n=1 Tax=Larimichthys crocea TaxID=215358 RepID=UPI000F5F88B6|nr:uncharacterized protein LOC113745633 [Larimichthys crocea]
MVTSPPPTELFRLHTISSQPTLCISPSPQTPHRTHLPLPLFTTPVLHNSTPHPPLQCPSLLTRKSLCFGRRPAWFQSPKLHAPATPNDYRPVALTSHIMKTMERLVLEQLRPMVKPFTDPLQFTYQPHLGVDDAINSMLNRAYTHLDKAVSMVRVMFFDFSCPFNTTLLREKLMIMQDTSLVSWIVSYLTGRPQYVRLQHCVSDRVVSNMGAPQGTPHHRESCHLQKYSDDSAIVYQWWRGDRVQGNSAELCYMV